MQTNEEKLKYYSSLKYKELKSERDWIKIRVSYLETSVEKTPFFIKAVKLYKRDLKTIETLLLIKANIGN